MLSGLEHLVHARDARRKALAQPVAHHVALVAQVVVLDVYKRQGHELLYVPLSVLPSFSIEDGEGAHIFLSHTLCGVQEKEALAHELGPVSYTHLDVYKRQVHVMELRLPPACSTLAMYRAGVHIRRHVVVVVPKRHL